MCQSAFYDTYDDYYYADADAVQSSCVDDYPYRCMTNREALASSILGYRTWNESGYLNITIPAKPRPVLQAFGESPPDSNIVHSSLQIVSDQKVQHFCEPNKLEYCLSAFQST